MTTASLLIHISLSDKIDQINVPPLSPYINHPSPFTDIVEDICFFRLSFIGVQSHAMSQQEYEKRGEHVGDESVSGDSVPGAEQDDTHLRNDVWGRLKLYVWIG